MLEQWSQRSYRAEDPANAFRADDKGPTVAPQ